MRTPRFRNTKANSPRLTVIFARHRYQIVSGLMPDVVYKMSGPLGRSFIYISVQITASHCKGYFVSMIVNIQPFS